MKKVKLTTTFGRLHAAGACKPRYRHLAKALGGIKKYGRGKPISLLTILDTNGPDDCLWTLRATAEDSEKIARRFACFCARRVLPIFEKHRPEDKRPRVAIEVAERHANGKTTDAELAAARGAARAARDAARAARDAAWAAAGDAEKEPQERWLRDHLLR